MRKGVIISPLDIGVQWESDECMYVKCRPSSFLVIIPVPALPYFLTVCSLKDDTEISKCGGDIGWGTGREEREEKTIRWNESIYSALSWFCSCFHIDFNPLLISFQLNTKFGKNLKRHRPTHTQRNSMGRGGGRGGVKQKKVNGSDFKTLMVVLPFLHSKM